MGLVTQPLLVTALMLAVSNLFMTFAWYGHLKNLSSSPWYVAALVSWGIALFEYMVHTQASQKWTTCFSRKINEITIFKMSIKFDELMDKIKPLCPFFKAEKNNSPALFKCSYKPRYSIRAADRKWINGGQKRVFEISK